MARGQGHKTFGQEYPFRGQTFSRPRTGMLKAKDTGGKCSPKKRSSHFSVELQKKQSSKKFFKRSTKF